eukprot:c35635_g1_i1 orf=137-1222(-)
MATRSHPFWSTLPFFAPLLLLSASASNVLNNKSSLNTEDRQHSVFILSANVPYTATIRELLQQSTKATVPAVPVDQHPNSCQVELSDELFDGLREACSGAEINRRRCCPILVSWLLAARAKVALRTPASVIPGMPELPDDSTVCAANLEAVLEARGLHLTTPNASCDMIMCFCGFQLNKITAANCANMFYDRPKEPYYPGSSNLQSWDLVRTEPPTPSKDDSSQLPVTVRALKTNCADLSYTGCTKCLSTLQTVTRHAHTKSTKTKAENLDCQVMSLVWLLAINQTLYVPTVSTVLRAIMYTDYPTKAAGCSQDDWATLPLAVESPEISGSVAQPVIVWMMSSLVAAVASLSIVAVIVCIV